MWNLDACLSAEVNFSGGPQARRAETFSATGQLAFRKTEMSDDWSARNRRSTLCRQPQLLQGREVEQGRTALRKCCRGEQSAKTQRIFENGIRRRPRSTLTIRQRTRVLQEWPPA